MIASLGMYELPWLTPATDGFWAALRDRLRAAGMARVPDTLERGWPLEAIWRDPDLLLAQTCGFPLMTSLQHAVRLVATPCYDLPGCDGPLYCSFVVVAGDDPAETIVELRGGRVAINGHDSQSGMNALRALVAPHAQGRPFFRDVLVSGGHLNSLAAIRSGRADVAAIDCVTYGLVAEGRPDWLDGTRVLCRTASAPGLPYVIAIGADDAVVTMLAEALSAVTADPALHLAGFARLSLDAYRPILAMRDAAAASGYPGLP